MLLITQCYTDTQTWILCNAKVSMFTLSYSLTMTVFMNSVKGFFFTNSTFISGVDTEFPGVPHAHTSQNSHLLLYPSTLATSPWIE